MKREIKFRAWSNEAEQMVTEPAYIQLSSEQDYNVFLEGDGEWVKKECVIMQYTGLKDKNGKDIYEGDLVSIFGFSVGDDTLSFKHTVEYYEGAFGYWLKDKVDFVSFECNTNFKWQNQQSEQIKVIGNLYVNPSLLTH